jgi:hypothetical protein
MRCGRFAAAGEKANATALATYQACVKDLRANRTAAGVTLLEMQAANKDAARKMQAKMSATWEAMQKSLAKASNGLSK